MKEIWKLYQSVSDKHKLAKGYRLKIVINNKYVYYCHLDKYVITKKNC